jgi:DNA gyrase subunit A
MLLNGASGIAVGMATNIPPHNLGELADAIMHLIDNPDSAVEDLMKHVPGPDFPTGGVILGVEGIREAYATGKGRVVVRAKAYIEESRAGRYSIIVTELPFQVNKASLHEKIAELISDDKLPGASLVRDESDRNGMRLVIELKRDAQPKKVLNLLFKYTAMQSTFGVNMVALVNGNEPRILTLKKSLQYYVDWRHEVITKRTRYELKKAQERAHILEGLKIALDNLDAVIATIRASRTTDTAKANLRTQFKLSDAQAQAILDMRLARLAALERKKIEDEYEEVIRLIAQLEDLLANPRKILQVIKDELADLRKKYGEERRTRIWDDANRELSAEDLIAAEDVVVTLSQRGYIKRQQIRTFRSQRRGGKGKLAMITREEDAVRYLLVANTHDSILFFTNRGRVFITKVHALPEASRHAKGLPIINLPGVQVDQGEFVSAIIALPRFEPDHYLVMATRRGQIKKTSLAEYARIKANGLIAINLVGGDELRWVDLSDGSNDIIIATRNGQAARFAEREVRAMGRDTMGVTGIRLKGDDEVIGMEVIRDPGQQLLVVTEQGYGKRTDIADFPVKHRATGGVIANSLNEETGRVAAVRLVGREDEEVMLITEDGTMLRTEVAGVNSYRRASRGVTVMRPADGDRIISIAVFVDEGLPPEPETEE